MGRLTIWFKYIFLLPRENVSSCCFLRIVLFPLDEKELIPEIPDRSVVYSLLFSLPRENVPCLAHEGSYLFRWAGKICHPIKVHNFHRYFLDEKHELILEIISRVVILLWCISSSKHYWGGGKLHKKKM